MKRIYLILTGISLILLSSCAQRAREAKGHQTVKIDTVVSADKQTFLQFPGKVKAAQDISLAFRVSGTISKIHVKDGARVQEGQLLAELDPTDYQVQLDATEAEYQQIKAEAERVSAIPMPANKRNYQKQADHLEEARAIRDIRMKRQDRDWREGNGRPKGSGEKSKIVEEWQRQHPDGKKADCIRETGLSKPTVYKWWK